MKRILYTLITLCIVHTGIYACGYDFVGGCSCNVRLKINGTEGVFALDPCNNETSFQGLQLGSLRTLSLSGAQVITWESCINNVTAANVYYRIYPTAQSGGTWSTLNVPEDHNTLQGPYTTRYRIANSNVSLTNGLSIGTTYTLEVYVRAEVDTLGDDFVPETFILKNNGGANYKLQFTYGGPNAPALLTVVTQKQDVLCWGKPTGLLGVSVFGNQPQGSLFYQWSSNSQNFFLLDSLTAGTYTVTVTESPSGNTATVSAQITQPNLPISLSFSNVTAVGCNQQGMATVNPSGGTGALHWTWSNGDTTQTAHFNQSGIYAITITDAVGCTQKGMVNIAGQGNISVFELPYICEGETYLRGGQSFNQAGLYAVTIPAPNGCDSIINFYLNVVSGAALVNSITSSGQLTCAQPSLEFCANSGAAAYQWSLNGNTVATTPCLSATEAGTYLLAATVIDPNKTCLFTKQVEVTAFTTPPSVSASASGYWLPPCYSGGIQIAAEATVDRPIVAYTWTYNGTTTAGGQQFSQTLPAGAAVGNLSVSVTDIYGCQNSTGQILIPVAPTLPPPVIQGAQQATQCDGTIAVELDFTGGADPVNVYWSSGAIGNPVVLQPGFNNVEVLDAAGCTASVFVIVEDFNVSISSSAASGQTVPDGQAEVAVHGAAAQPVTYLWSNGQTGAQLTGTLPGNYCVTVTEGGGCTRTACVNVDFTVGATQPFTAVGGLSVWPNPTTAGATVQIPALPEKAIWQLVNTQGILCNQQNLNAGQTQVEIPLELQEGMYFIMVKTNKISWLGKIFLKDRR